MSEQQALRAGGAEAASPSHATSADKEYRSGVFAKARRDGSGWGLVLADVDGALRTVALCDGAVVGASSRDAKVEGPGVASEHARVTVRSDGCYLEDLGSAEGTFVDGVRARRIGVTHGDVVRLGRRLAVFVERDLASYAGPVVESGEMVHGPRQRLDWIEPALELARSGSSVCIEGPAGVGKRALARLVAAVRESAGEVVTIDGASETKPTLPPGARPQTWVVLAADRLARPQQLEIAHAVGRGSGVSVIITVGQPLDRAAGDGAIAPWFASLFSGKRVAVPALERRREDIPAIVGYLARKRGIPLERIGADFLEALVRSGWPGGVPQLDATLGAAFEATPEGPLVLASVASTLTRATRIRPSLPPHTDPSLARARLEDALARANGSVASAARALGMSRQAIYREADRLGLEIARRKSPR
jgi:hypothetical protein